MIKANKSVFGLILCVCIIPSVVFAQQVELKRSHEYAKSVFKQRLKLLDSYIRNKTDSAYLVPGYIYDFEELTQIPSESDGNILGKLAPTIHDLKKWKNWYKQNNSYLMWNDSTLKMYCCKHPNTSRTKP